LQKTIETQEAPSLFYRICERSIDEVVSSGLRVWCAAGGRFEPPTGSTPHPKALALIGAPMRDRQELCQAVSQHLGRRLAGRYGFDYPAALEEAVLRGWEMFLEGGKE